MNSFDMLNEIIEQETADIFLDDDGYIIDDYSFDNSIIETVYDL